MHYMPLILTHATAFSGSHFGQPTQKLLNSNVPYILLNEEPCQVKTLQNNKFL